AIPDLVVCIAESVPPLLQWLRPRTRLGAALVGLFVLLPVGFAFYRLVDPWTRADSAGAAAYVLAERHSGDIVAVNSWECLYYFRSLGDALLDVQDLGEQSAERIWMVLGDRDPQERLQ